MEVDEVMSLYDRYEKHLKQQLSDLQEEYQLRAKPIIDQLVHLANLRPPSPMIFVQGISGKRADLIVIDEVETNT
ncbi:hypothetical protein ACWX0O_01655 [Nitrobacteraceae bacterium UC4449_H16]